jgi:hypothetical protein
VKASERSAFRQRVSAIIESSLELAGWRCVPYARRQMKLFAREGDVTPFFLLTEIEGRYWGDYVITGGLGIIHRPFERHWASIAPDSQDDGLTAILHSANLGELRDLSDLDPHEPVETLVYAWCEAVVALLDSLPRTHTELCLAHNENRLLAGKPLEHFLATYRALPQRAGKATEFLKFLEGFSSSAESKKSEG